MGGMSAVRSSDKLSPTISRERLTAWMRHSWGMAANWVMLRTATPIESRML